MDGEFITELRELSGGRTLEEPMGIAVDRQNRVYVVDRQLEVVCLFENNRFIGVIGHQQLNRPQQITLRQDGIICITQPEIGKVAVYSRNGDLLGVLPRQEDERFHHLGGIAFRPDGKLIVCSEKGGGRLDLLEIPAPRRLR